MPRLALRLALWLVVSLGCLAASAYTAAHVSGDFQPVRAFLNPIEGCGVPCWQGIRPGITGSLEAVDTLRALPWVTDLYTIQGIVINDSYIRWKWTGQQPEMVDGSRDGRMWFHNGLVYSIEIPLTIPFSTVWGAFGAPESETLLKAPLTPPSLFYSAAYLGSSVEFKSTVRCPPTGFQLLIARVDANFVIPKAPDHLSAPPTRLTCDNAQR